MVKKIKWFKICLEGKDLWDVLFLVIDVQLRFFVGWFCLFRELGLVVGDVCMFKFIKFIEMFVKVLRYDDEDDDIEEDDDSDEEEVEDVDEDDFDDEDVEDEDDVDKSEDQLENK